MQNLASDTLFHFVGRSHPTDDAANFEILAAILKSMELRTNEVAGRRSVMLMRRDPARPVTNGEPIEQKVVCLCDIPIRELRFHSNRYGRFGVGISRSVAAQWGTRPVIYIPTSKKTFGGWGNRFADEVRTVVEGLERFFPDKLSTRARVAGSPAVDAQDAVDEASGLIVRDMMAFLKFFDVDLPDDHPENFYLEREWRKFASLGLAPSLRVVVTPAEYHEPLKQLVDSAKMRGFSITGPVNYISIPD